MPAEIDSAMSGRNPATTFNSRGNSPCDRNHIDGAESMGPLSSGVKKMASRGTNVSVACKPSEFNADPELAYKISKESQLLFFGVNDVLFRQGDSPGFLYLLKCGEAVLTMEVSGKTVICVRAGAGSLIGLSAIAARKPYTMTARASGDLYAFCLAASQFEELLESEPNLPMSVLRILAAEIRSSRGDVISGQPDC